MRRKSLIYILDWCHPEWQTSKDSAFQPHSLTSISASLGDQTLVPSPCISRRQSAPPMPAATARCVLRIVTVITQVLSVRARGDLKDILAKSLKEK